MLLRRHREEIEVFSDHEDLVVDLENEESKEAEEDETEVEDNEELEVAEETAEVIEETKPKPKGRKKNER